jgi:hypothetical protein
MRVRSRASLMLATGILLLSGWGVFSALDWPWKAKLFPLVIGIPLFCLAAAEIVWSLFGAAPAGGAADYQLSDAPPEVARRRTILAAAWMLGFFAAIVLVGFPYAVPLLLFAFLKVQGKEGWLFTAVFTAAVSAAFYGLFDQLLHLPFPEGWVFAWLGSG